jgi:mannose-6-phosphate isomerase
MVFVDAGTVHAVMPGVIVLETQQYSDTTYRLFDYGRPRELHIEAGLAATKNNTRAGLVPPVAMNGFTRIIDEQYFFVDRFDIDPSASVPLGSLTSLQIVVALGDGATLNVGSTNPVQLRPGHAVVLPVGSLHYDVHSAEPVQVIRIGRP